MNTTHLKLNGRYEKLSELWAFTHSNTK